MEILLHTGYFPLTKPAALEVRMGLSEETFPICVAEKLPSVVIKPLCADVSGLLQVREDEWRGADAERTQQRTKKLSVAERAVQ